MRLGWLLCAALSASSCTSSNGSYLEETASRHDPLARATQADLNARPASGGGFLSGFGFNRSDRRRGEVYYGADTRLSAAERASLNRLRGEEFEVNLDNADIAVAARSVLGEILRVSYTLDPRVTGQISIVTARPMPADEILLMFETSLRSNGVAMVRERDRLRLMPAAEALGVAELDQGVTIQPGYGVTVLPLRHVSADTILPLLENFVARSGMVREDPGRNALIFQGTAAERAAAIEAARSFDQDWLANESVGVFPVANSSAAAMIPELNRVLDLGEGGRGRNTIRIQPIDRSNSILVVARSRDLLQRAANWIQRLDRVDASATSLRVYRVQHVDARRLAAMVNDTFTGSASVTEDPAAQFPPGSTPTMQVASSSLSDTNNLAQRMGDRLAPESSAAADFTSPAPSGGGGGGSGPHADVRITANPENNSLLIFARPDQHRLIEQAIIALDRPSAQVSIEATIAEVTLTNDLRYGVQFYLQGNDGSVGLFQDAAKAAIGHVLPGFNLIIGPETEPRVVLDALRGITDVKVLSSPSVVVMDNKPATLQVGDEVPIVTRTAQSTINPDAPMVNNVEFRNTGVILNVLPRVTANGTINLLIEQEISSVLGGQTQTLTPTISQRRVNSTVSVASGQTVLLGGLISERQQKGREGIPVLGELPIVGEAFRRTSNNATRTELIVLIRAQVIRDSLDAQRIAQEMRSQLRLMNESSRPVPLLRPTPSIIE